MALRVEAKSKLTISHDNSGNPQDIVFQSGDKCKTDTTTFSEGSSKALKIAASTTNEQVDLDNIASCAVLFLYTDAEQVSVTLVPTGGLLADCLPIKLLAGYPMMVPSDLAAVYLTNADTATFAIVKVGAVGN